MKRGKKKGISPVVATTLLIAIVVFIALIIFLWFRGVVGDYGVKFGKNIELVCEDVEIDAGYSTSSGDLFITNDGNVPIFKINLKISRAGSYQTEDLSNLVDDWPREGLDQGGVFSGNIALTDSPNSITLIPVLIGTSDKGEKKAFTCGEEYGYEILIV